MIDITVELSMPTLRGASSRFYEQDWGIEISDDQIRLVVNELGRIVHANYDTAVKDDAMRHFNDGEPFRFLSTAAVCVLYIEMTVPCSHPSLWLRWIYMAGKQARRLFRNTITVYRKTKIAEMLTALWSGSSATQATQIRLLSTLYAVALKHGLEHAAEVVIISAIWRYGSRVSERSLSQSESRTHPRLHPRKARTSISSPTYSIRGENRKLLGLNSWLNWSRKESRRRVGDGCFATVIAALGIPNIYNYLQNNRDCIDRLAYLAAGYFIGSGAI